MYEALNSIPVKERRGQGGKGEKGAGRERGKEEGRENERMNDTIHQETFASGVRTPHGAEVEWRGRCLVTMQQAEAAWCFACKPTICESLPCMGQHLSAVCSLSRFTAAIMYLL